MKLIRSTYICLPLLLLGIFQSTYGQNGVAIAATTATADNSAMLDVQSTTKGALIPRMTNSQRGLISSPANGLLVYCTDAPVGLYYYNTSIPAWVILSAGALTGSGTTNYDVMWTGTGTLGNGLIYNSGSNIGIGTTTVPNTFTVSNAGTTASTIASYPVAVQRAGSTDFTIGSDASSAYLQSWNSKPLVINSQGNNVGIGLSGTSPAALLSVGGTTGNFQVTSAGAIGVATGVTSSGTITFSGLGSTAGVVLNSAAGVLSSTAGALPIANGGTAATSAATALTSLGAAPASGSANYIQNTTTQQASSNFNISGAGVIGTNLTVGGTTTLANNNGGSTHPLYLAGIDLNHYIYSTGTGGNSMFFGEYSGVYNFYNTATATTQIGFNAGNITATGVAGTGTRPVWANASGTLNNSGRVNVIGGSTITGIAVGTAETNYVTTGTMAVVSGELIRLDGTISTTFPGGSGTDHFTVTIRSNGTSPCTNTTFCVETLAPMGNTNRGTYYTYPFIYYWNVNCTGNVTFTIDVATLDSDDSWNINGAALTATKQ